MCFLGTFAGGEEKWGGREGLDLLIFSAPTSGL